MNDKLTVKVELAVPPNMEVRRCFGCGRFWAYETFSAGSPQCPVCSGKSIAELQGEVEHMQRAIRALRGALTKRAKL